MSPTLNFDSYYPTPMIRNSLFVCRPKKGIGNTYQGGKLPNKLFQQFLPSALWCQSSLLHLSWDLSAFENHPVKNFFAIDPRILDSAVDLFTRPIDSHLSSCPTCLSLPTEGWTGKGLQVAWVSCGQANLDLDFALLLIFTSKAFVQGQKLGNQLACKL